MINRFGDSVELRDAPAEAEQAKISTHVRDLYQRMEKIVVEHPKQCLIAALTTGALLAWLTRRR